MQGIGIGVSDFKRLRIKDNYFIDKSLYIKNIIDNQSGVILITRPRRFGKTLNMSMLKYYFDCKTGDNKELFKGLKIMEQEEQYTSKLGYYPVIYITLKDVVDRNYENMLLNMKTAILEMYQEHMYLLDSDKIYEFEKEKIKEILFGRVGEVGLKTAVKELSKYLNRHYDKTVMLLVDETVITGVSRVAKESIFSGANNFKVYTVLDNEFSSDFGITEDEMEKTIEDFKIEEAKNSIKEWYDGYTIGEKIGIYNPWSILNYLTDRKLVPYWVNTSSNDLIKLILKNSTTVKEKVERLLKDEPIEVTMEQETVIVGVENNEDNIWGLLMRNRVFKSSRSGRYNRKKISSSNTKL